MGSLEQIKLTLRNIKTTDMKALSMENIEAAIQALESELACLETVTVQGKENMDKLLGVIITIEAIIGKDKKE